MATAAVGILAGRLALVTGGGSGIGRAVCSVFAREGAILAVADINKSTAEQTISSLPNSTQHTAYGTNVASASDVSKLMEEIEDKYQKVPSAVVHAAGITRDKFLLKLDEQAFDDVISVNLKGTFLINQALARAMIKSQVEDGSIVNISSVVGRAGNLGQANYAASKAGVIGFTKTAAKELARYKIRVNVVLPGYIQTPMTAQLPDKVSQQVLALIPMQRIGQPEEIAEVCAFLASSRSSYITGASIDVNGGYYM